MNKPDILARNETQAATIDRIRIECCELKAERNKLKARVDIQQRMIDWFKEEVLRLKSPERFFE